MSEFRTRNWIARSVVLLVALLFAVPFASAQVTTGNLQGIVRDQNDAVVAGASVKVTNTATGATREATTNEEGFYRVTNLLPGDTYMVEVTAAGFQPTKIEQIAVRLGVENSADIKLGVQVAGGTVQVTGETPLIQSTQSQLSTAYTPKQLTQLPFNGSIDNLALLTPGVVTPGDADFTNGVGISANGNRARSNNFQIDGQDNNDNSVAGPTLSLTNAEAIGEYQIITNSFSAEFGRNSGAQVNVVTRSGTNEFHGALFEFHQNAALNARDNIEKRSQKSFDFLAKNGFPQFAPFARRLEGAYPFLENRLGGRLGGPIKENKAFFFATYEGTFFRGEAFSENLTQGLYMVDAASATFAAARFNNPFIASTAASGQPSLVQGQGTFLIAPPTYDQNGDGVPDGFAFAAGNPFGNPVTGNLLAPLAVVSTTPGGAGRTVIYGGEGVRNVRSEQTTHQLIGRVDWNVTDKDTIIGRYIFDDSEFPLVTGRFLQGALFDVPSRNNNFGVTYTRIMSPNSTNEARFNFSRLFVTFGDTAVRYQPQIGIQGNTPFADYGNQFNSFSTYGTLNNLPQSRKVDVYQYQDTFSTTWGNHALKFGADIRQQKVENFFLPNFLGVYAFRTTSGAAGSVGAPRGDGFFNFGTNGLNGSARSPTGNAGPFENYLLGRPARVTFAAGDPAVNTNQNDFFFFVQDDWRIRPTLTLNLGLRYEISSQPFNPIIDDINAREANASTSLFPAGFPLSTRTANHVPVDKNNFAPRFGFAWSPNIKFLGDRFSNGRTVIRGGFGISYDPSYFNIVLNTVTAAPYAAAGTVFQTPGGAGSFGVGQLPSTPAQLALTPGTNGGDPRLFNQTRVADDFRNPYTMSFNFGIQQELHANGVIEARYVGSRIVGQFQTINANPDLRVLALAAAQLFETAPGAQNGNPTRFTHGVAIPSYPGQPAPSILNGFNSRPVDAAGGRITGSGRLDPNFGPVRLRLNGASSTYHGLQIRYDTRLANSLTLNANYSLSKTIDNASEIFSTFGGGQTIATSQDPFDYNDAERGLSAFHQKHTFTANFLYELPWYKEQRGWTGKLLGGYQLNGIVRLGSGRPYTPALAFGNLDLGFESGFLSAIGPTRPFNGNPNAPIGTIAFGYTTACDVFGAPGCATAVPGNFIIYNTLSPGSTGTVVANAAAAMQQARLIYNDFGMFTNFAAALGATANDFEALSFFKSPYGDVGRNTFSGEPFYTANMSVFKTTKITENVSIEFRAEAFNLFNRRNFGVPDTFTEDAFFLFSVGSFQNPGFNNGGSRTMRLGVRLIF